MNFLSGLYNKIKIGVAGLGGILSIGVLGYGIYVVAVPATGGTSGGVLIGAGAIWLLNSIFNFVDSTGVAYKIRQEVDRLETNNKKYEDENLKLEGNVEELKQAKDTFVEENKKLIESVKKSAEHIENLESLKEQYLKQNDVYKSLINKDEQQLEELKTTIVSLNDLKNEINEENNSLKLTLENNVHMIEELEITKNSFELENEKLQESNKENAEQIEILKQQNIKLKELFNESNELLKHLAKVGDMFNDFNTTIGASVVDLSDTATNLAGTHDDYENTLTVLKQLTDKLKDRTFDEFDKDGDGIVTKDEFNDGLDDE